MRGVYQSFRDPGQDIKSRHLAVSAFLDLGDKLRSSLRRSKKVASGEFQLQEESEKTLLGAIEGEIIPRLLLVHREAEAPDEPARRGAILTAEDRARFLGTVMTRSAASTRHFIEGLLERGVPHEAVLLDLLTHAARRLGELWEDDQCDFAEVTIGLCRLHQVLRELSSYEDRSARRDAPRVLLATACGDQHVLGVVMVAEFFRRSGWRVWSEPGASRSQLCALLAEEVFDVLGLSVACSILAEDVAEEIRALRKASRNAELKVMVGGRLFVDRPDLVAAIGADGSATDASTAPTAGSELLARR